MRSSETVKTARAGRWGDREDAILDAAWRLIAERGFDKTTMADVALEVGLSEGSLYNYFSSKKKLGVSLAERWFTAQAAKLQQSLQAITAHREKLCLIVQYHLADILQERELYLMWIREVRATASYGDSSTRDIFRSYTNLLKTLLQDARDAGEIHSPLSNDMIRDLIYGGVEHVAWTAIVQQRADEFDLAATSRQLASSYWQMLSAAAVGAGESGGDPVAERLARIEAKLDQLQH